MDINGKWQIYNLKYERTESNAEVYQLLTYPNKEVR